MLLNLKNLIFTLLKAGVYNLKLFLKNNLEFTKKEFD